MGQLLFQRPLSACVHAVIFFLAFEEDRTSKRHARSVREYIPASLLYTCTGAALAAAATDGVAICWAAALVSWFLHSLFPAGSICF
jgi:hypothetical protein